MPGEVSRSYRGPVDKPKTLPKWPEPYIFKAIDEHASPSMKHVCKPDKTCICYALATEPNEKCPVHGVEYPPRCSCGRFVKVTQ